MKLSIFARVDNTVTGISSVCVSISALIVVQSTGIHPHMLSKYYLSVLQITMVIPVKLNVKLIFLMWHVSLA